MYLLTSTIDDKKTIYHLNKSETHYICTLVKDINNGRYMSFFTFPIMTHNFMEDFLATYRNYNIEEVTDNLMMELL